LPVSFLESASDSHELPTREAVQKFYAQGWLYVHMLRNAARYRPRVTEFHMLMLSGTPTHEALERIYQRRFSEFDGDARAWFEQGRFPTEKLKPPTGSPSPVETRKASSLTVELARATVSASSRVSRNIRAEFARLAKLAGDACEHQAALGDLAFAGGLSKEADEHYERASAVNPTAPVAVPRVGTIVVSGTHTPPKARDDSPRELLVKASTSFRNNDFAAALSALDQASGLSRRDQFAAIRMKALSLAGLGRFDEATSEARKLAGMAADDEQRLAAKVTLDDVDRARQAVNRQPEPLHHALLRTLEKIEGTLVRVDCGA
jgi:tetratricopeptide (TPR) repeat protein